MPWLIVGLILFIAAHSTRIFTDDWRSQMMERRGEKRWKGLIALVSIAGFVLMMMQGLSEIIKRMGWLTHSYEMDIHYERPLQ